MVPSLSEARRGDRRSTFSHGSPIAAGLAGHLKEVLGVARTGPDCSLVGLQSAPYGVSVPSCANPSHRANVLWRVCCRRLVDWPYCAPGHSTMASSGCSTPLRTVRLIF